jgi:hypothetical protein
MKYFKAYLSRHTNKIDGYGIVPSQDITEAGKEFEHLIKVLPDGFVGYTEVNEAMQFLKGVRDETGHKLIKNFRRFENSVKSEYADWFFNALDSDGQAQLLKYCPSLKNGTVWYL